MVYERPGWGTVPDAECRGDRPNARKVFTSGTERLVARYAAFVKNLSGTSDPIINSLPHVDHAIAVLDAVDACFWRCSNQSELRSDYLIADGNSPLLPRVQNRVLSFIIGGSARS